MSDKLQPKSADKELAKSISLNIHRHFLGFSGFRLFTQRVKGQNDEKARGYWVNRIFQILIGGFGLQFVAALRQETTCGNLRQTSVCRTFSHRLSANFPSRVSKADRASGRRSRR